MKFNFNGIRFKTWLYFFGFTCTMLLTIGLLLSLIIRPYYRDSQIEKIGLIKNTIIDTFIKTKNITENTVIEAQNYVKDNNVCVIVFNDNKNKVFSSNSLGDACVLNQKITLNNNDVVISNNPTNIINYLNDRSHSSNEYVTSLNIGKESLLVAEKFSSDLSNYYLFINAPLEIMGSYVNFLLSNYLYASLFVIVIAILVSYFLATRITKPIIKMKKEAVKLASGDYGVSFKQNSYSEINDLARTLDDATDKLSKVDELRKDLIANVSHDIKTPLTMIKAYAEMIKDISGDDKKKRNEHLDVIISETEYLDKLAMDMLEYSKMQAGYIELSYSNVDLTKVIKNIIKNIKSISNEKSIRFKTDLDSVIIFADEVKISQVINNFITNAIKYSNEKGIVEIKLKDLNDKARFDVIDNGKGIKDEDIPYIWDRYYKIDKKFSRNKNSFGLGLAIAKAILEAHKAKYGVSSKIDEGSDFYFIIDKGIKDE